MAFWGTEIKPGRPFTLVSDKTFGRLRISQATLGLGSSNSKSSSVQCNVGKRTPVLLCSLLPDKIESLHLELEFQEAEDVTFSVIGPRSVHLTGYVVGKPRQFLLGDDESESFGEDLGDADTEASDEDVNDEDEYGGSFIDDGELKYSSSPSLSEDFEALLGRKEVSKKKSIRKRLKKTYELSDSEDDFLLSLRNPNRKCLQVVDSDEDDQKLLSKLLGNVKDCNTSKRKVGDVAGQTTRDQLSDDVIATRSKLHNATGHATSDNRADESKVMAKKQDIFAGRATDDCHKTDGCQSTDRKVKRKVDDVVDQETDGHQSNDRKCNKRKKRDDVVGQPIGDCQSDNKVEKKKRKNKKSLVETEKSSSVGKNEANASVENGGTTTDVCSRTISGGLVIDELEIGKQDGKVASSGRKVTIHYTGRLKEQGQIFCSTVGESPLKFRLGKDAKDAAIDGLHLGIDGMRAGGKRRLLIPPELGYGSKGGDGVPPNAWLVIEVELLRVR
ncbi:hypothetical protein RND81_05G001600 [Saponaria officinalis]|uniref:peptidylprolyl isomerase n=1 Tax=Saponaria officinalis TaxID=3572 RepID=A0AAW1KTG0_SAPOF